MYDSTAHLMPQPQRQPRPRRILVAGPSGVGKTALAREIEAATGIRHTEIDALFHGPNWTVRPDFVASVEALIGEAEWVTEWQYSSQLGDLLATRADTIVWLDLPVAVHMARLVRRTVVRRLRRVELWSGNVEPPLHTIFTDRDHIIRWGWRGRAKIRERVAATERDHPKLRVVRLRSQREAAAWVRSLSMHG